eukprot:TRINITY_DN7254_c0_g1_i1.p1 TRINITY_DN7254_c0_g1~~TRINITY_DN7254_c0_g1_i1.p1  ORF type:complete len:960 (+),score=400.62 TRINITY_DN7254_c0_g1_i1:249-3128(+)
MALSKSTSALVLLFLLSFGACLQVHAAVEENAQTVHIKAGDDPDGDDGVDAEAEEDANDAEVEAAHHEDAAAAEEEAEGDIDEVGDEEGQNHEDDDPEDEGEGLGEDEHTAPEEDDEESKPTDGDEEDNRDEDHEESSDEEEEEEEDEHAKEEQEKEDEKLKDEQEEAEEEGSGSDVESEQDEVDSAEDDAANDEAVDEAADDKGGDQQDGAGADADLKSEVEKEEQAENEEKSEEEEEQEKENEDDKNSEEEKEDKQEEKKAAEAAEESSESSSSSDSSSSESSSSSAVAEKKEEVKSALSQTCQACRIVIIGAIRRNTTGLHNPCMGHQATMMPACNAFMAENYNRIMKAVDPNPICVSLGFCSRDEATLASTADKEKAAYSKAANGKLKMESGRVVLSASQAIVRHMRDGTGHRQVRERVPFPTPFEHPPFIHVGLSKSDIEGSDDFRVNIIAENVDRYGFDLAVTTWGKTEMNAVGVDWFAYGKAFAAKGLIRSGRLHATNPTRFEKVVSFPVAFPSKPKVAISFNGIDAVTGRVMRLNVQALDVDKHGFKARFQTWKDSVVRYASVSWVAFANSTKSAAGVHEVNSDVKEFSRFWNPPLGKRVYTKEILFKGKNVKVCRDATGKITKTTEGGAKTVLLEADILAQAVAQLGDAPKSTARDASSTASKCTWVNSTGPGFVGPPGVRTELSKVEFASEKGDRVDIEAIDIDKDGFTLRVQTDKDTRIKQLGINWFAHEKPIEWNTELEKNTLIAESSTSLVGKNVRIAPKNNPMAPGKSCKAILEAKESHGDGFYWVRVGKKTIRVYCDMQQGGWMRVVNIVGTSTAHSNNAHEVDAIELADATKPAKLSDDEINSLDTVGYFRFRCGSYDSLVTNNKKQWTSLLNNNLKWRVSRSRNPDAFTCDATNPGHTFSEEIPTNPAVCKIGYAIYAARSAHDGRGCYHNGWGKSGSVWVQ